MKVHSLVPRRQTDAHKGDAGHVFVVAGQRRMIGAAALAARGALRAGAGLVTVGAADGIEPILATKLDDAMTLPLGDPGATVLGPAGVDVAASFAADVDAVAIGPGIGQSEDTRAFLEGLLPRIECPLVVDADALSLGAVSIVDAGVYPLGGGGAPRVLTPHPGEMARLMGLSVAEVQNDRNACAVEAANRFGAIVVLKGAGTVVTDGRHTFVNETGNPGLATGGSGDVLAGVIVALLGQGLAPYEAAVLGVHAHGLAGDRAAAKHGTLAMAASDIVDQLGEVWQSLEDHA